MASVFDIASYILKKHGPMTTMKLQKLVYYAQAWSLVWDEKPLFRAQVEAWASGPVVPTLYQAHRGRFKISQTDISGDSSKLTKDERDTVDAVLRFYADKPSQWLSDLTHQEHPWKEARGSLPAGARSDSEITRAAMLEYYSSL